ncbi:Hypothetical_protein [Hexamita inflata]|uniref:Hypothetical_protein n=1 Tax=Hexamita inflata TaxID=28002 RepID=A0AA86QAY3_9EUKA|nr:Hypothetical protein HINF_LOCUS41291 [Hexamita inflata]
MKLNEQLLLLNGIIISSINQNDALACCISKLYQIHWVHQTGSKHTIYGVNGHLQFMFGFGVQMNEIPMGVVFNEKEGKIESYYKKKYEGGDAMEFMNQFVQEVVEGKIPLTKVERGRRHDEL